MINHHNNYNNNCNNSNNSNDSNKYNKYKHDRTMTVLLYGLNEHVTIDRSYQDIGKIGYFAQEACGTVDLYYGTCLVDCDDSTTYQCPVIKLGDYSVWYSTINDSSDRSNTGDNENGGISDGSGTNGAGLTLYESIVTTCTWLAGIVAILVCTYQC